MYAQKKVLALIPARGGSKGIKNKNIINIKGKPLLAYSILAAQGSKYIDDIVVSTDSATIANVARQYRAEAPFMRPAELATDTSKTIDAVIHAIHELGKMGRNYDILCLLQPTQPLRTASDIDGAIEMFAAHGNRGVVSVSPVNDNPILIRKIDNKSGELLPLLPVCGSIRRQDMPAYYRVNGCIYVNAVQDIHSESSFNDNVIPYIMAKSHSVDIDEEEDIALAEYYLHDKRDL